MHILIIPSWFPSSFDAVAGSFFLEQAVALAEYGNNVGVVAVNLYSLKKKKTQVPPPVFPECLSVVHYEGVCVPRQLPYISWFQYRKKGLELFERYFLENGKPDIIIAQSSIWGGVLACKLREIYKLPYIIIEHHSHFLEGGVLPWQKRFVRKAFGDSSMNFAVSKCLAEALEKEMSTEVKILPNMVSESFLEFPLEEAKDRVVLTVCGLSKIKNVELLVHAFSRSLAVHGYILKICGDGEERKSLEELVKELGINHLVQFTGWLTRDQVIKEMSSCSVFVLPSYFETFGMVLVESLALGVPVISTKSGGPQDIINDGNGILVNSNNIKEMSSSLLEIVSKDYDREELRLECKEKYSARVVLNKLLCIIEECLMRNSIR